MSTVIFVALYAAGTFVFFGFVLPAARVFWAWTHILENRSNAAKYEHEKRDKDNKTGWETP